MVAERDGWGYESSSERERWRSIPPSSATSPNGTQTMPIWCDQCSPPLIEGRLLW